MRSLSNHTASAVRVTLRTAAFGLITATILAACADDNTTPTGTPTATGVGVLSGSAQVAPIDSALSSPLVVHVTDQYGNSLPNAPVTFTATGGATVTVATVTTDSSGDAQTTVRFSNRAGVDTVIASVSGVTTPATFFESALAGAATTFAITNGNSQSATTGTALAMMLAVQAKDQFGNALVGDTVSWTAATGTLSAPTSVTDSTGTAQISFIPAIGSNSVLAALQGMTATFTETGN